MRLGFFSMRVIFVPSTTTAALCSSFPRPSMTRSARMTISFASIENAPSTIANRKVLRMRAKSRALFVVLIMAAAACATRSASVQPGVVARMWHGRVPDARAEEYYAYLKSAGITRLEQIPGSLGAALALPHLTIQRIAHRLRVVGDLLQRGGDPPPGLRLLVRRVLHLLRDLPHPLRLLGQPLRPLRLLAHGPMDLRDVIRHLRG